MNNPQIRSALFVPGNRPERFAKALASAADVVIVDFEDAVPELDKAMAREHLSAFLQAQPTAKVWVRVNMAGHTQHPADLAFCTDQPGVCGVMLPKAERAEQVACAASTGKPVIPIIESAEGLYAVTAIAQTAGVQRLTYGGLDMSLDLGLVAGSPGAERMLDQLRFALLLHTRLATGWIGTSAGDRLRAHRRHPRPHAFYPRRAKHGFRWNVVYPSTTSCRGA